MMNFIRDNIVKIGLALGVIIIVIVIVAACSSGVKTPEEKEEGYIQMENKLQSAAIKYMDNNKRYLPREIGQNKRIQLSTLIANNYINSFNSVDDSNLACKGYVDITKKDTEDDSYRYTPFIKCGKYYETKTIVEHIIENEKIVTTGEGLYQIVSDNSKTVENKSEETKTEDNNETTTESNELYTYYYKGEYPNNYVKLGNKIYRIIEITEENNLKLVSTVLTEDSYEWDDRYNDDDEEYTGINDFIKSRMKENLDFLYTNASTDEGEVYFTDEEKNLIVSHDFCVGSRSEDDTTISYKEECSDKEKLKVGLISLSDYYRASIFEGCTATDKLGCNNYNYLYNLDNGCFFTLTANSDTTSEILTIDYGEVSSKKAETENRLLPVIYIDKNVLYKSGTGSKDDPYIVR